MAGALPEIDLKRLTAPLDNAEISPVLLHASLSVRVIPDAQNMGTLR